jgi:hypothetical protein
MASMVDTFNRSNSTTSLGTSSDGSHTYTVRSGTAGISSNQAYFSAVSGGLGHADYNAGISDGWFELKISSMSNAPSLVYRWSNNTTDGWAWGSDGTNLVLRKRVSNVYTTMYTRTGDLVTGDILGVRCVGNKHYLYLNGTYLTTVTDSHNQTATRVGIRTSGTGTRFDDLKSLEVAAASTLSDNFDDNSINSSLWDNGGTGVAAGMAGGATETLGQLQLTSSSSAGQLKGILSDARYNLDGSSVFVFVPNAGDIYFTSVQSLPISMYDGKLGGGNIAIHFFAGSVYAYDDINGFHTNTPYDYDTMKWMRIRGSGSTIYYDYSFDGSSWFNWAVSVVSFPIVNMHLGAEIYNGVAETPATMVIDNYNVAPNNFTNNPTDALVLSDAVTAVKEYNRSATDGESLSDSISAVVDRVASTTDAETLTDTITAVQDMSRSATDGLSLSDSVAVAVDYVLSATDNLGLSDTVDADLVIGSQDYLYDTTDDETLSDSVSAVVDREASASDVLDLSDDVTRAAVYNRSTSDDVALSDEVAREAAYLRTTEDALGLSDTASAVVDRQADASDVESLSDAHTTALEMPRSTSDALDLSDSLSAVVGRLADASDEVSLSDSVSAVKGTDLNASDALDLSDSFSAVLDASSTNTENLSLTDEISADVSKVVEDVESLSDSHTAVVERPYEATDALDLADSVTALVERASSVEDSVDLSDEVSVVRAIVLNVSEDTGLSETLAKSVAVEIEDLEALADQTAKNMLAELAEDLALNDSVGIASDEGEIFIRNYSDALDMTDEVFAELNRPFSDTLTLSDSVTYTIYRMSIEDTRRKTRLYDTRRKWRIN